MIDPSHIKRYKVQVIFYQTICTDVLNKRGEKDELKIRNLF